ncbi:hypothetical protein LTS10_008306 [Elasticomyces elasticus]|nr:hypothetical protein LTS10_008306 [Elasticomyces elasticus]
MSGVGEIASVIGLTDIGVKGIRGLHNLIRDLRNVPEDLQRLHEETASLQDRLAQLEFLKEKDQVVSAEVAAVGIEWKIEAKKERKQISLAIVDLEDDSDGEDARAEMDEESRMANEFLRSCDDVVGKLKAMKLNQSIEHIVSAGGANVQTGMPASVVDKVANQHIRGVYSAENSVVRVGIW